MNKFFKYLSFIMLFGCEINTPPLPPLNKPSFSYDQVMQQQKQLEEEIQKACYMHSSAKTNQQEARS